jgi:hypothetical protein
MEEGSRLRARLRAALLALGVCVLAAGTTVAKQTDKGDSKKAGTKDKGKSPSAAKGPPPGESVNACGCYRDTKGGCVCTDKKAKCECAGECEPVGCSEKRDKEMEREIAAEVKRAQDDEKRRQQAQEAEEKAEESGAAASPDGGAVAAAPPPPPKKPAKGPRKSNEKSDEP